MNKKAIIFLVAISLMMVLALFVLPAIPEKVNAQTEGSNFTGNIVGWMWSSNIGWIKLDSNTDNPVVMTEGQLSGYAWSPSIGWIDFNPAEQTYPSAPEHGVQVDTGGENPYPVTGWARACSVFASGCAGALKPDSDLGGWDGWISIKEATYDTGTKVFSGYAWGGLNIGWAQFNSPIPPDPPSGCTEGDNCLCTDPNPPPGCPVICAGCGGGGPTLSCSVDPTSGDLNTDFTWTANYTGEETPTSYSWADSDSPLDTETDNPVTVKYSTPGPKIGKVTAMNGATPLLGPVSCNNSVTSVIACTSSGGAPTEVAPCCVGEEDTDSDGTCGGPSTCTITSISKTNGRGPIKFNDTNPPDDNNECSITGPRSGVASSITIVSSGCSGDDKTLTFSSDIPSNAYFTVNDQDCSSSCSVTISGNSIDLPINIVYVRCPIPRPDSPTSYSPMINIDDFSTTLTNLLRYTINGGN